MFSDSFKMTVFENIAEALATVATFHTDANRDLEALQIYSFF